MKNLKKLLIPIGLIALVVGIVSFSTYKVGDNKKCTIKIVKIIDGVETVVDSTFDCDETMNFNALINGDSLHKMIKMMITGGDSGETSFSFGFDESDEDGIKVMKIKGDDGEEVEMKFDFSMLDDEKRNMKMMINGEKLEIKLDNLHKELEKLHENMKIFDDESGNIEITIDSDEDGKEAHTVKIIKTIDDDGNVTMKKIVDGKETEIDAKEMHKNHGKHKMMFIGEDGKMDGNHEVTIDVQVGRKDKKHMVIITKVSKDKTDEAAKNNPVAKTNLNKKELKVDQLNFSPNPNNGKFNLDFKLAKNQAVQIKIFDVQGKEVYNETVTDFDGKYSNNIDISGNGEGIYLLQIVQGEKASTNKIVIK